MSWRKSPVLVAVVAPRAAAAAAAEAEGSAEAVAVAAAVAAAGANTSSPEKSSMTNGEFFCLPFRERFSFLPKAKQYVVKR
jgi:hypothetical protein